MKNFTKQFNVMFVIGVILMALGLAGCQNEDEGESADSGNGTSTVGQLSMETSSAISPGSEGFDNGTQTDSSVFETGELGVLVRAPAGTSVKPDGKAHGAKNAVASAILQRNNFTYTVLVYEKGENEVLQEWMKRSEVGDAYLSPETLQTLDNRTAFIYETNDLGLLPSVHATVATDRFVYRFDWDDGLPEDAMEAVRIFRENPEAYKVPEEFLEFLRHVELQ